MIAISSKLQKIKAEKRVEKKKNKKLPKNWFKKVWICQKYPALQDYQFNKLNLFAFDETQ